MTGLFLTSKNLSPLRTPFFIPSPVSTELASTLSLNTPVETSGEVKVSELVHLSNLL